MFDRQIVASVPFIVTTLEEASRLIVSISQENRGRHVHLANAYTTVLAATNSQYGKILRGEAIVFPDGRPISWISALHRHRPRLRTVPGPDLFESVMREGLDTRVRHFLLGSTPIVLDDLEESLRSRYEGLEISGTYSPPFRALTPGERKHQSELITKSNAHIVWVGLGTPKQDFEVRKLAEETNLVCIAVGAAFDFSSNNLVRAPRWMSSVGLEWAFRLAKEPRRLWRRYIFGNAKFLWIVFGARK